MKSTRPEEFDLVILGAARGRQLLRGHCRAVQRSWLRNCWPDPRTFRTMMRNGPSDPIRVIPLHWRCLGETLYMRILLIEDDAMLASYIRKGLESEHHAVDVALDGAQGALMASDLDYDLLVLDSNLPKLDGISVLRNLRPIKPDLPILILTGRPRVADRVHALDSGADDCLACRWSALNCDCGTIPENRVPLGVP